MVEREGGERERGTERGRGRGGERGRGGGREREIEKGSVELWE